VIYCEKCRFSAEIDSPLYVECRKNAPHPILGLEGWEERGVRFGRVRRKDWCGEGDLRVSLKRSGLSTTTIGRGFDADEEV